MIPAEAVEAAAKAHQDLQAKRGHPSWDELGALGAHAQQLRLDYMAAALEAAAPYLMAAAWAGGAKAGFSVTREGFNGECAFDHCADEDYPPTNPYNGEKWTDA